MEVNMEVHYMPLQFSEAAKARQLREYFARHGRIYIVVNATGDDVIVPEHLHGDPALRLVLNVRMPQTIHIRDNVLESELSFSGRLFHCRIPMQAIWATYVPELKIENGILWEEDVPETIREIVRAVRRVPDGETGTTTVSGDTSRKKQANNEAAPAGKRPRHLRVVK